MTPQVPPEPFRWMLDTNIISDLMRDPHGRSSQRLAQVIASVTQCKVCTSLVVDCEISFGLARKPSRLLEQAYTTLRKVIEIMPMEATLTRHYAAIRTHLERQGTPIGPNDTLIAAHALALDCTLVTDNTAEFSRVTDLRLENWLTADATRPAG